MPTMQERDRMLAAKTQPYGLAPEDDARDYTESRVVNITDEDVVFKIAQGPNAKPRRYRLAPFKQGNAASVTLQDGYVKPYKGAGRKMVRPIIERLTMRHVFPSGPRMPMVVDEEKAPAARAAWVAALAAGAVKAKAPITFAVRPEQLEPVARAAKAIEPKFVGEEVGNEPIEPPHPDDEPIDSDGPSPTDDPLEPPPPPPTRRGRA